MLARSRCKIVHSGSFLPQGRTRSAGRCWEPSAQLALQPWHSHLHGIQVTAILHLPWRTGVRLGQVAVQTDPPL
jgi:hypothetical protein